MADPRPHQLPTADARGARTGRAASAQGLLQNMLGAPQHQPPGWGDALRYDLERAQTAAQDINQSIQAAAGRNLQAQPPAPQDASFWQRALQRIAQGVTAPYAVQRGVGEGVATYGLGELERNQAEVESWTRPLEGPSRALGAAIMGQNPFVDGSIEGPTVSEALMERGAPPWVALLAEFAVPDPTGVGRAADLIPLTSAMLVGFRGLKSLVPNSTSDYHAALKLFERSSDLTRTAPELGPEELRLVARQVLEASTRGDALSPPVAELTAHALRLQQRADGLEYAAANPPADLPRWRTGEDGIAVGGLQPTDVIPALGDLAIQGRTVNISDPWQRSLALESIESILTHVAGGSPESLSQLPQALLAASAYPDEKGRLAARLLASMNEPAAQLDPSILQSRVGLLAEAFRGSRDANRDWERAGALLSQAHAAGLQGYDHQPLAELLKQLDEVGQEAQAAITRLMEASAQDVPGIELTGEMLRDYEDVLRMVAEGRELISTRYLADALEPVPSDVMALLEEVTRGLDTGSEDGFMAVFHTVRDFAHSPGDVRALLTSSLSRPERVPPELMDEATNYVWEIVNGDPTNFNANPLVTWRSNMLLEQVPAQIPPERLKAATSMAAASLGMSEQELAQLALNDPGAFRSAVGSTMRLATADDVENLRLFLADPLSASQPSGLAPARPTGPVKYLDNPEQVYDVLARAMDVPREMAIERVLNPDAVNSELLRLVVNEGYDPAQAEAALRTLKGLPPAGASPQENITWGMTDEAVNPFERWRQQAAGELEASGEMSAPGPLGDKPLDAWLQDRYKMLEQQAGLTRDALIDELEIGGGQAVEDLLELFGFSDEAIDTIIDDLRDGLL